MAKETVGDMIVRHRKSRLEELAPRGTPAAKAEAAEIRKKFTPRSLTNESWPPA